MNIELSVLVCVVNCLAIASCHSYGKGSHELATPPKLRIPEGRRQIALVATRKGHKYPYLLAFHRNECEFCQDMEALINRANVEHNLHIKRLDVASDNNYELMVKLDRKSKCGGLPFFYNLLTHQHICGATNYRNLIAWANGKYLSNANPYPLKEEEIKASYRRSGLYARIMVKLRNVSLYTEI
ncbi:hypothetical protein, conserved [Babesia bigemina]|uniref:Uncharacterized protein n=1 Tax=Babesia bigemina TaxID=5866 RepID=A0A061D912_BABBI|nr:hypothetical protein, conserved [Babesia bigemina]CDR94220.1 hypothetical protein, conserved [Babesia bigemina]|eukprot:XP_012766406.1 hypothetical protein, conserved [Babesia bigemina]